MMLNFSFIFANGQLPVSNSFTYDTLSDSSVYISANEYGTNYIYRFGVDNQSVDYFSFIANNKTYCVFAIPKSISSNLYWIKLPSTTVQNTSINQVSYNNYYYYQAVVSSPGVITVNDSSFPSLGTFNTVYAAYDYYVANGVDYPEPPSSIGDGYLTNGLPVGNVIYFDLGSSGVEYDITLKSYFTSKSSWFGSTWVNDNRRYGFSDSLPTTSTNFDESSGNSIPWSPSGSTDLLGRSDEGSTVLSGTSTARYLWILNPLYNLGYYDEPDKGTSLNGNIFYIGGISVDTPYYIYSLKQSATSLGLSSDVASSVGGVGSVTSSGAINTVVNDGSGTEYVPSVGGDNSAPQEVSATEGIKQTLDQFVQMFLNIFTAPISHIQQLISTGSEFITHLSGMWSWLPNEISGFVISAFVVMVAISIFKLFL